MSAELPQISREAFSIVVLVELDWLNSCFAFTTGLGLTTQPLQDNIYQVGADLETLTSRLIKDICHPTEMLAS